MMRNANTAVPMKVVVVKPGTFTRLRYHMIKDTANIQFKMPRVLRKPELLKILADGAV